MNEKQIERLYRDAWQKYNLNIISSNALKQKVEYCADCMNAFNRGRAKEMLDSVQGL